MQQEFVERQKRLEAIAEEFGTHPDFRIARGEIYRVDMEPTIGGEQQGNARPCLVLSIIAFNKARTIVVVPLSSSPRPLPPLIVPSPSTGKASSVAL
jgi:mRNA interferase MazF